MDRHRPHNHPFVSSTARHLIAQIKSLGWKVSVILDDGTTALGRRPSSCEMHAVDVSGLDRVPHVSRASTGQREEDEAEAAVLLAQAVGIDLEG